MFELAWFLHYSIVPTAILCNYTLIFGQFGLPRLGMSGIGWGTSLKLLDNGRGNDYLSFIQ